MLGISTNNLMGSPTTVKMNTTKYYKLLNEYKLFKDLLEGLKTKITDTKKKYNNAKLLDFIWENLNNEVSDFAVSLLTQCCPGIEAGQKPSDIDLGFVTTITNKYVNYFFKLLNSNARQAVENPDSVDAVFRLLNTFEGAFSDVKMMLNSVSSFDDYRTMSQLMFNLYNIVHKTSAEKFDNFAERLFRSLSASMRIIKIVEGKCVFPGLTPKESIVHKFALLKAIISEYPKVAHKVSFGTFREGFMKIDGIKTLNDGIQLLKTATEIAVAEESCNDDLFKATCEFLYVLYKKNNYNYEIGKDFKRQIINAYKQTKFSTHVTQRIYDMKTILYNFKK